MKYYTIVFPGEFGQHVVETWSTDQIIRSYYTYWATKILENNPTIPLDKELCIEDWCVIHWAEETDEFGNKINKCHCHKCNPIDYTKPKSVYMRLCPICGNKRCPKATDHNNECTNSNEPGQVGSIY